MTHLRAFGALTLAALGSLLAGSAVDRPAEPPAAPTAVNTPVRGMTLSCPRSGQIWATDATVESMALLRDLGVNWVAIHPYGPIGADGTVGGGRSMHLTDDAPWLRRPIDEAHRLGLKIMIKPHIAYWHSRFAWRGDIEFHSDEDWDRFFSSYQQWVTRLAEICHDADAFVVGTELDRTVKHHRRWREIIASVRAATDAPLTYSANWDAYQRVRFWDDLDVIAVQAYFPLTDQPGLPAPETLAASWQAIVKELETFSRRHDRPVLLGELGYHRSIVTAQRPWEDRREPYTEEAEETQRRCLDAALEAIASSDRIVGAFLWKWFPGERSRGSHLMSTPAMRAVIADHWKPVDG